MDCSRREYRAPSPFFPIFPLKTVASGKIGNRSGRVEPRVLKRRFSSHFPYLNEPRGAPNKKYLRGKVYANREGLNIHQQYLRQINLVPLG